MGNIKNCPDCEYDNTGENRKTHGATCDHPEAAYEGFWLRDGYWCFVPKDVI